MSIHTTPGTIVLLARLSKAIHKRSTEELLGMTMRQLILLGYLRDRGGSMPQQELCEWMWVDPNSCVLLLNELEDLGYLARRRDPADRRRHVVELTDDGRAALERGERARDSLEDEILGALTTAERDQLRGLLARALESSG
ncbi:MAG TPA: MarR family winged helix-turn-helix transcriptional regulator [Solirubrobacteraceae bacterium]|nr:MarR family winged helix-turn-helix transcriptional regulator [Solirubrobacteraceae bacterium]